MCLKSVEFFHQRWRDTMLKREHHYMIIGRYKNNFLSFVLSWIGQDQPPKNVARKCPFNVIQYSAVRTVHKWIFPTSLRGGPVPWNHFLALWRLPDVSCFSVPSQGGSLFTLSHGTHWLSHSQWTHASQLMNDRRTVQEHCEFLQRNNTWLLLNTCQEEDRCWNITPAKTAEW